MPEVRRVQGTYTHVLQSGVQGTYTHVLQSRVQGTYTRKLQSGVQGTYTHVLQSGVLDTYTHVLQSGDVFLKYTGQAMYSELFHVLTHRLSSLRLHAGCTPGPG